MSRELLIELLISASSRPHSRCLRNICQQKRTYALAPPRRRTGDGNMSTPTRPAPQVPINTTREAAKPRPASEVPLAVGLDRNPTGRSAISKIAIPRGVKDEKFVPQPLARPLGLSIRPEAGQNSPIDQRTSQEKKAELLNRDVQLEQRQVYLRTFLRPYYQERNRVDEENKGKSFVSNERLFKKEKALYFPNMWGQSLSKEPPTTGRDTTPALMGKISVVAISSNTWAQEMVDSFVSREHNPTLHNLLQSFPEKLQRGHINVQVDAGRAWLQSLWAYKLRTMYPEDEWSRFWFVKAAQDVQRGLTDEIRDAMGYLNTHVGYVYLVDQDCKIRWAASGHAWAGEVDGLNMGIKRLLSDYPTSEKVVQ